jgi:hypothetical protein
VPEQPPQPAEWEELSTTEKAKKYVSVFMGYVDSGSPSFSGYEQAFLNEDWNPLSKEAKKEREIELEEARETYQEH